MTSGGPAARAGIVVGDVAVSIGGHGVSAWLAVGGVLERFEAGERVGVAPWRQAQRPGVGDLRAEHAPAQCQWSTRQVIGHLSEVERWFADDTARAAADEPPIRWATEAVEYRGAALAGWPLDRLPTRLELDVRETPALTERVPRADGPSVARQRACAALSWLPPRFREHLAQIEANLACARAAGLA